MPKRAKGATKGYKGPKGTYADSGIVAEDTANTLVILNVVENLCSQVLSSFA